MLKLKNETIWYVDDGSDDDTSAVLAALADRDPRVRVLTLCYYFSHQAGYDIVIGQHQTEGEEPLLKSQQPWQITVTRLR